MISSDQDEKRSLIHCCIEISDQNATLGGSKVQSRLQIKGESVDFSLFSIFTQGMS